MIDSQASEPIPSPDAQNDLTRLAQLLHDASTVNLGPERALSRALISSEPAESKRLPLGPVEQPPAKPKSPRRKARELALQSIYQWLVNPEDLGVIQVDVLKRDGAKRYDKPLYETLFSGVVRHFSALQEAISPALDRPQNELSPVELAILLAGTFEFVHMPETPYRVIINESVELAKTFGGTDGHKYVNGVLDKLAPRLRPHG